MAKGHFAESPRHNIVGQKFGRWEVLRLHGRNAIGSFISLCRCECGVERVIENTSLRKGSSTSCGCKRVDDLRCRLTTHGMTKTPQHRTWLSMIGRCYTESHGAYDYYGGRGIYVCDRWRNDFTAFLEDIGDRPSGAHELDRIQNKDGSYTCGKCDDCVARGAPANCHWVTKRQQQQNMRSNVNVTGFGETLCIAEWARRFGIADCSLRARLRRGMSLEDAVTTVGRPVVHFSDDEVSTIQERIDNGDSIAAISKTLGRSESGVRCVAKQRGFLDRRVR